MLDEERATIIRGQLLVKKKIRGLGSNEPLKRFNDAKGIFFRPYRSNFVRQLHGNGNNRRVEFRE
jgi:hypothetical protein